MRPGPWVAAGDLQDRAAVYVERPVGLSAWFRGFIVVGRDISMRASEDVVRVWVWRLQGEGVRGRGFGGYRRGHEVADA